MYYTQGMPHHLDLYILLLSIFGLSSSWTANAGSLLPKVPKGTPQIDFLLR